MGSIGGVVFFPRHQVMGDLVRALSIIIILALQIIIDMQSPDRTRATLSNACQVLSLSHSDVCNSCNSRLIKLKLNKSISPSHIIISKKIITSQSELNKIGTPKEKKAKLREALTEKLKTHIISNKEFMVDQIVTNYDNKRI